MLVKLTKPSQNPTDPGDRQVARLSDWLRISEAAEYLGVLLNTLWNWENADKIVAHRHPVNGYRLFKQKEPGELLNRVRAPAVRVNKTSNKPR